MPHRICSIYWSKLPFIVIEFEAQASLMVRPAYEIKLVPPCLYEQKAQRRFEPRPPPLFPLSPILLPHPRVFWVNGMTFISRKLVDQTRSYARTEYRWLR